MAGRQRHLLHLGRVPRGDDHTAGIGMILDQIKYIGNLVDGAVRILRSGSRPGTPLHAVDRAQIAVLIRPFIPDVDVMLQQPVDIRRALEEPQQLVGQPFEEHRFGGQQWEILGQVETHLLPEQGNRTGSGAIGLQRAFGQNLAYQILIRHGNVGLGARRNTGTDICKLFFGQSHTHQCSLEA